MAYLYTPLPAPGTIVWLPDSTVSTVPQLSDGGFPHPAIVIGASLAPSTPSGVLVAPTTSFKSYGIMRKFPACPSERAKYLGLAHPGVRTGHDGTALLPLCKGRGWESMTSASWVKLDGIVEIDASVLRPFRGGSVALTPEGTNTLLHAAQMQPPPDSEAATEAVPMPAPWAVAIAQGWVLDAAYGWLDPNAYRAIYGYHVSFSQVEYPVFSHGPAMQQGFQMQTYQYTAPQSYAHVAARRDSGAAFTNCNNY